MLKVRLKLHADGTFEDSFTAKAADWELFYSAENLGYVQARKIESHIKKMKSKTFIRNLKKHPELIENLMKRFL